MTKYFIREIRQEKNGVVLLVNKTEYLLSINDFTENYYYPNKELSCEEFQNLKEKSKNKKVTDYISFLLSSRRYTAKQIKDKLKTKFNLLDSLCEKFLLPYQESQILDDMSYAIDYCESKISSGYGKNYIIQKCKEKGISEDLISSEKIQSLFEDHSNILIDLISKQNKIKKNLTIEQRKNAVIQYLLRRGFSFEDSNKAVCNFYSSLSAEEITKDSINRKLLLKKDAEKCYNLIVRKSISIDMKKNSFIKKLLSKGYRFEEIQPLLKEYIFHD